MWLKPLNLLSYENVQVGERPKFGRQMTEVGEANDRKPVGK